MNMLAVRSLILVAFSFTSSVAYADCWRLPSGQVVTTSAGSSAPARGAQRVQCPVQQKVQQPAQQNRPATVVVAPVTKDIANTNAPQSNKTVAAPLNIEASGNSSSTGKSIGGNMAGSTAAVLPPKERLLTVCGPGVTSNILLQVVEALQATLTRVSFDAACKAHDNCYDDKNNPVATRDYCDKMFLNIATEICNGTNSINKAPCIRQRDTFYFFIQRGGANPYCRARGTCPKK